MDNQQTASKIMERRKHPRIKTENTVSYILFDGNEEIIDQGKGKTLNLSLSGALLKTEKPLNGSSVLLITLNLDGKKLKVKGRVANTRQSSRIGIYLSGIEFIGPEKEQRDTIVAFVKAYYRCKHSDRNKKPNLSINNPK
ncbi:MAG: PilZ domain-containing protein [Desulfobacterales bacterium]|nr:PilZ domain-containing protein [Desulfobacterales bacterium]